MTRPLYFILALLVMAGVTYLIRLLPLLFVRKRIKNPFFKSFLYYVPYVVLSVMAFPAIVLSTKHAISGILAAAACVLFAYRRCNLIMCMLAGVLAALVTEAIFMMAL